MNSSFGLNSHHAHMFNSSIGSREQQGGPQSELPISLSHGRTHYDLIPDDAGKDVYLVRGRPDPWRYTRRGGRPQRSANTNGGIVDSDSLLFAWRVRRDLESGRFFFSNCGGMGKKWRLPDYFDLGFQEEMQTFLLNNPTFGEQRSKQEQQQRSDERTKNNDAFSRGEEATANTHVNHRDKKAAPHISRDNVEEKLTGSNKDSRSSFARAPVSSAHDALSLSSSSLANYHSQQPAAGTKESGLNYGSLRHDRQDLARVDEQLLTSQTHSTSSRAVVPAMLSRSSSSSFKDRVNSHQKAKERNGPERSRAQEREEAVRERISAEAMLVAQLDAEREKSIRNVAAGGRRAKEEEEEWAEELKEDEPQPPTHLTIEKTPIGLTTRELSFPFNNDSRTASTTTAAATTLAAAATAATVSKDSSVSAIDTLTSVVNSLQSLLDAERADRKQLEMKLREKDRILYGRVMADTEAEEDDIQLKLKIIEAIAIRRKEDARMREAFLLSNEDDNKKNTSSSTTERRSHTSKEDTSLPATTRKKALSYSSTNTTAEAKETMETEDAYYF